MIKIKAREKDGVITYRSGRRKEAEIYQISNGQFFGQYYVDYAFTKTGCAANRNRTLSEAKQWAENLLKQTYAFRGGVEIEYA